MINPHTQGITHNGVSLQYELIPKEHCTLVQLSKYVTFERDVEEITIRNVKQQVEHERGVKDEKTGKLKMKGGKPVTEKYLREELVREEIPVVRTEVTNEPEVVDEFFIYTEYLTPQQVDETVLRFCASSKAINKLKP